MRNIYFVSFHCLLIHGNLRSIIIQGTRDTNSLFWREDLFLSPISRLSRVPASRTFRNSYRSKFFAFATHLRDAIALSYDTRVSQPQPIYFHRIFHTCHSLLANYQTEAYCDMRIMLQRCEFPTLDVWLLQRGLIMIRCTPFYRDF